MPTRIEENRNVPVLRRISFALAWSGQMLLRALGFAAYGLAALSVGYAIAPVQRLVARRGTTQEQHELRAQRGIYWATHAWLVIMKGLRLIRVRQTGVEALRRGPVLVVANHPSLIDSPLLTTCMPQADFVVSPDWRCNPILRRAIEAAGYLHAEHGARLVREAVARLRDGRSVVVYPEGSRTPPEGLRPFQRGVAHIAMHAGCDVVPVVIRVNPRWLMKGDAFSALHARRPEWHIEVGEPIRVADLTQPGEGPKVTARRITAALQDHFEKRWERGSR